MMKSCPKCRGPIPFEGDEEWIECRPCRTKVLVKKVTYQPICIRCPSCGNQFLAHAENKHIVCTRCGAKGMPRGTKGPGPDSELVDCPRCRTDFEIGKDDTRLKCPKCGLTGTRVSKEEPAPKPPPPKSTGSEFLDDVPVSSTRKPSGGRMDLRANPEATGNVIDYHDGAVVSKTVIDKPVGTVTFFAFDKGEGLSEHTAPYDAMVQIIEGEAEVTVSSVEHRMKAGDIMIMPANEPHALLAVERFKMILTMIRA